jgi:hypothetical protein
MRNTAKLLLTAVFAALATPALAYTSYLKPSEHLPEGTRVTVQGAFATTFFSPEIALSAEFVVIEPSGTNGVFNQVEITPQTANLSTVLHSAGTYRITSGERLGRVSSIVGVDGGWRPLADGEVPPEGAPVTTIQTVSVADTYVTRGEPSRTAVDRTVGRLSLRPITHPNQVLVSQGMQVQATFAGAPFANAALVLYREGDVESDQDSYFATDAQGNATITFDQPGHYILAARHRANAAPGAEAAVQSYTTTLVFEALAVLPPIVETIEDESASERRRRRRDWRER